MTIFQEVKQHVNARDVASFYGYKVTNKGLCICPFHNDHHPSMGIGTYYHCFACGAKGDAISFVASLFSITNKDAALKIIDDFHLPIDTKLNTPEKKEEMAHAYNIYQLEKLAMSNAKSYINRTYGILCEYERLLKDWKEAYKPKDMETNWNDCFVEALKNSDRVSSHLDSFLLMPFEEQLSFSIKIQKEGNTYEETIKRHKKRKDHGRCL